MPVAPTRSRLLHIRFPRLSNASSIELTLAVVVTSITLLLAAAYAWLVPLPSDGGWYSYPGYALSEGRDPSENLLPADQLASTAKAIGTRATFAYELRTLTSRWHALWFDLAGTTVVSLKVFGLLQWLTITSLVGFAAWTLTRSLAIVSVVSLAAMSDSWLISGSMSDLRPDVPITLTACALLVLILLYARTNRLIWLVGAFVLVPVLPLLHSTGILACIYCCTCAALLALVPGPGMRKRQWGLLAFGPCGALAFVYRQPLLDALVPTTLVQAAELPFRDDLASEFRRVLDLGIERKLGVEAARWSDYFLIANIPQLLFLVLGMLALIVSLASWKDTSHRRIQIAFLGSALAAIGAAVVFDPTTTRGHLIPLACLMYVAAGFGAVEIVATSRPALRRGLVALGLLAFAVKGAQTVSLVATNVEAGVSNQKVTQFLAQTLGPTEDHLLVSRTSLWPYLDPARRTVLIDPGSRVWDPTDVRWASVTGLVVDSDLLQRGWQGFAEAMVQCGAFDRRGALGKSHGGYYLEVYAVNYHPNRCVPPADFDQSGSGDGAPR